MESRHVSIRSKSYNWPTKDNINASKTNKASKSESNTAVNKNVDNNNNNDSSSQTNKIKARGKIRWEKAF